jgi:SAM-dependent methyltransferase
VRAGPWSNPSTSDRALALLDGLDWRTARVADVGAGPGWFSHRMSEHLSRDLGLDPRGRVLACDLFPRTFEVEGLECLATGPDGRLPFPDASVDAAVSIEVIEHVEDPFAFLREIARIVKPGGRVIVSTPNVLSLSSRVRTLLWGFPELFDPLPLSDADPKRLGGHIQPMTPYFLAYAALRAGLVEPRFFSDRTKRSSAALALLLSPALLAAQAFHRVRLSRKRPAILRENRELIAGQSSWSLLTSRSTVLCARKPAVARDTRPG